MMLQVVVKKFGETCRGAVIVDGKFQDIVQGDLDATIWNVLAPVLEVEYAEGTTVDVILTVTPNGK